MTVRGAAGATCKGAVGGGAVGPAGELVAGWIGDTGGAPGTGPCRPVEGQERHRRRDGIRAVGGVRA